MRKASRADVASPATSPFSKLGRVGLTFAALAVMALMPSHAWASEAITLPNFDDLGMMWPSVYIVLGCAIVGLLFGLIWYRAISKEDPGSKGMVGKEGMVVLRAMQDNPFSRDLPIGSNAWAVGPSRSADGATRWTLSGGPG